MKYEKVLSLKASVKSFMELLNDDDKLWPLYSISNNWRLGIRKDNKLDVRVPTVDGNYIWKLCSVLTISKTLLTIVTSISDKEQTFYNLRNFTLTVGSNEYTMDIPDYFVSEDIFPPGTYTTATKQQPPKVTPAINSKIPLGTSDVNICSNLGDIRSLYIHKPHSSTALDITVGSTSYRFTEDDHLYKMLPFLSMIPPDLQSTRSANESNRCFFIHLGIAVGIHPFAL